MNSSVVRNADYIRALSVLKKDQRLALLQTADKKLVEIIVECILNTLNGNIPLSNNQKRKLRKHRKVLRNICFKKTCWKKKKKQIIQSGGAIFLPTLLAPLIGGVLGSLFN
ncbi:UNVERIFIED_CONTAM: hypothetical protein B566_EDAN019355 [Ephemera danica]|nr:hypothetical protein B566_EDAN019355 [Ephemera danica]